MLGLQDSGYATDIMLAVAVVFAGSARCVLRAATFGGLSSLAVYEYRLFSCQVGSVPEAAPCTALKTS